MKPLVLLLPLAFGAASAPAPRKLESLFTHHAQVTVTTPGANALALPLNVLMQCRADWGDLRLLDEHGVQVPYWLDQGELRPPTPPSYAHPTLKTVSRREIKAEGVPNTFEERLLLSAPPDSKQPWTLDIDADTAAFVTQLEWAWSTKGKESPARSLSAFRLADGRSQLSIPLEEGAGGELRVTVRGENGHFLEPRFRYRRDSERQERAALVLPLNTEDETSVEGKTTVVLNRPGGWVPNELLVETTTPAFSRRIWVYDLDDNRSATLIGTDIVSRLSPSDGAARMLVRLAPPRGKQLRVEFQDGDSPPLLSLHLKARGSAPRLLFFATSEHVGTQKLGLYFGSTRVGAPSYDVAGIEPSRVGSQFVNAASATASPSSRNPSYNTAPLLQFAWTKGAAVEASAYSHQLPLHVADSGEGVTKLAVPVEVVAKARVDLADIRIVDATAHQVPYVRFASAVTPEWVPLQLGKAATEAGETRLTLRGPGGAVPWRKLRLHVGSQFVERSFTVEGTLASGKKTPLTSGTLRRADGSGAELEIDLPETPVSELEVRFKEGDAAPLAVSGVDGQTMLPLLHVLAPVGEYSLLVGQPEATPPQYQLDSLRELVSQLDAPAIVAGKLIDNPDFTRLARLRQGSGPERAAVWAVLGLGVLVLGAFTLRLLRKQPMS